MVQEWGKRKKGFLNLQKDRAAQGSLRTIIFSRKEIHELQKTTNVFDQTLFIQKLSWYEESNQSFLGKVPLIKLNDNQALESGGGINENEFLKALISMDVMIKR